MRDIYLLFVRALSPPLHYPREPETLPRMAALEQAMQTMLDGDSPLVKLNAATGKWCCMLCKRQFPTEKLLGQHCSGSTLHRTNLAEAKTGGRIRGGSSAPPPAATKRPLPSESLEPPSKLSRWGERGEAAEPSSSSEAEAAVLPEGKMSALEQMELFEKRLKVQAKRAPAKEEKVEEFEVDSNRARTINNQMDWECSACGQFNFARSLTCHSCKAHVNADTKYLTNRLKEMKCAAHSHTRPAAIHPSCAPCPPPTPNPNPSTPNAPICRHERFARVFGSDAARGGVPPPDPNAGQSERHDGSGRSGLGF